MKRSLCCLIAMLLPVLSHGCRAEPEPPRDASLGEALGLLQSREAWTEQQPLNLARHPAEKYLAGWVIVLDPGHGGDAHREGWKRGPTGEREAEMNWRVAVLLRELLRQAGVHVIMTREGDEDVSLAQRAELANTASRPDGGTGADLFLSLHHNANGNPNVNYTSIWFHAEADWSEPCVDVARYLAHAIARALRTDVGYTSPLMSDQQIYRGGFGVLRDLRVPGVLIESSFYSNPAEEQRLADPLYNLREAYAIYEALCEYAYGGRPTQSLPQATVEGEMIELTTVLDNGLPREWWGSDRNRIITSTIAATLDGETLPVRFDPSTRELMIENIAPDHLDKPRVLSIHHTNFFKHHNWPQRYRMTRIREDDAVRIEIEPIGPQRAVRVPD